jgi:hypothetical protein
MFVQSGNARERRLGWVKRRGRCIAPVRSLAILTLVNTFGVFGWWGRFTWIPAYLVLPLAQGRAWAFFASALAFACGPSPPYFSRKG